MQALILAGGMGTRLRPVTYHIPKPMVPIHGKPFLWHQLMLLRENGFKDILLLVGYLGHVIEEYFRDGCDIGMKIRYSYEDAPLGTAGAIKNADKVITGDFLLLNGDTFLPIDYVAMSAFFLRCGKIGLIAVSSDSSQINTYNMKITESAVVASYDKKNAVGMNCKDAGAGFYKRSVLELIDKYNASSFEEDIYPRLISESGLAAYKTDTKIYDIGTQQGLKAISERLK